MQDVIVSKRCNDCRDVLPMREYRFDVREMRYAIRCRDCEKDYARDRAARSRSKRRNEEWPECDLAVIRGHYTTGGTVACMPLLPHKSRDAIRAAAKRMGLRYEGPPVAGSPSKDDCAVPLPAPHDYAPEDHAWMNTRLPVYGRSQLGPIV